MTFDLMIAQRIRYLKKSLSILEKELEKAPKGRLRGNKHGAGWQYYYRKDPKDGNGVYIKKSQMTLAKKIAQRDYDRKLLASFRKEYTLLTRLARVRASGEEEDVYSSMPKSFQPLIRPLVIPIETAVRDFLNTSYESNPFIIQEGYYTMKGRLMRSKSEMLIGDRLDAAHVPFLYEKPLLLPELGTVYPDFTIFDRKTRKEIYWEHFGLMDDRDYRNKALYRIECYAKAGYFIGDRLLVTFETSEMRLNTKYVDVLIRKFLV